MTFQYFIDFLRQNYTPSPFFEGIVVGVLGNYATRFIDSLIMRRKRDEPHLITKLLSAVSVTMLFFSYLFFVFFHIFHIGNLLGDKWLEEYVDMDNLKLCFSIGFIITLFMNMLTCLKQIGLGKMTYERMWFEICIFISVISSVLMLTFYLKMYSEFLRGFSIEQVNKANDLLRYDIIFIFKVFLLSMIFIIINKVVGIVKRSIS